MAIQPIDKISVTIDALIKRAEARPDRTMDILKGLPLKIGKNGRVSHRVAWRDKRTYTDEVHRSRSSTIVLTARGSL
jgi:hypothetical protein